MMKSIEKVKTGLDRKFQKVTETPASFDFFVAIHDFVKYIELNALLSGGLSHRIKINRELGMSDKYGHLRQIYQGLEDIQIKSNADLGHTRYTVIRELNQIKNNDYSESNTFWKKRELSRKLIGVVYERLGMYLSEPKGSIRK